MKSFLIFQFCSSLLLLLLLLFLLLSFYVISLIYLFLCCYLTLFSLLLSMPFQIYEPRTIVCLSLPVFCIYRYAIGLTAKFLLYPFSTTDFKLFPSNFSRA